MSLKFNFCYAISLKSVLFSVYQPSLPKEALVEANKLVASLTRETNDAGPAPKRVKKLRHILSRGLFEDRTICY